MMLASPDYQHETLVQHGLTVQAGLSQWRKIKTLARCWAPDIPAQSWCFPPRVPKPQRTPKFGGLAPDGFRPDGRPVTVKKGR